MVKRLRRWWDRFLFDKRIVKLGNRFIRIEKFTFEESVKFTFRLVPYIKALVALKREKTADAALFYEIAKNYTNQLKPDDLMEASALLFGVDEKYLRSLPIDIVTRNIYLALVLRDIMKVYYLFQSLGALDG